MRNKIILMCMALILIITGFILIGLYSNWMVALGIFLFLWGNNIERGMQ